MIWILEIEKKDNSILFLKKVWEFMEILFGVESLSIFFKFEE